MGKQLEEVGFVVREDAKHREPFYLETDYVPKGDQPAAIASLVDGLGQGLAHQCLLGVTGSGKTFTMTGDAEQPGVGLDVPRAGGASLAAWPPSRDMAPAAFRSRPGDAG